MARRPHHTLTLEPDPVIDFTLVARILTDAATLVHTRTERGDPPRGDHRPRILDAIDRAARCTTEPRTTAHHARDWAVVHTAMCLNAVLGRGRHRDGVDVTAASATLAGFGLDVGTLGAVSTATDVLHQAADTARNIAHAVDVQVDRYGPVLAYPIAAAPLDLLEPDDIIAVAPLAAGPAGLRILQIISTTGDSAGPRLVLDTGDGRQPWPTGRAQPDRETPVAAWRPVPHRHHPWRHDPKG
jgi:hypothetical protein